MHLGNAKFIYTRGSSWSSYLFSFSLTIPLTANDEKPRRRALTTCTSLTGLCRGHAWRSLERDSRHSLRPISHSSRSLKTLPPSAPPRWVPPAAKPPHARSLPPYSSHRGSLSGCPTPKNGKRGSLVRDARAMRPFRIVLVSIRCCAKADFFVKSFWSRSTGESLDGVILGAQREVTGRSPAREKTWCRGRHGGDTRRR